MINRRDALRMGLTGSAACAAMAQAVAQRFIDRKRGRHGYKVTGNGKRPNIFLLTADMVSPDHYHRDRPFAREMNLSALRSLASDSVVFHNAFCASPLCAPARAALLTGRYTYITANGERAHDGHETILRPDDVIFPEYLKAAGYITKHCGKGHLGVQKFIDAFDENVAAWDRWDPPIHKDEGYLSSLRRLRVKPQKYSRELRGLQQDRKTPANSFGGWVAQSDGAPFPLEASYSYYLAQLALEKVDAAVAAGGPIYLQLDIFDPHQPFSVPDGFAKREAELRAGYAGKLPRSYREVQAADWGPQPGQPKIYDLYRKYWGLYDAETVVNYRVANALQMEVVDRAIGLFLDGLRARGLYDDSLIVFTADHGEMNGRRAVVDKGVYLFSDVLRVPLTVKMPRGHAVHSPSVEAPVSHLDLAPTLMALCGIQPEERLDGISLLPTIEQGQITRDRDFLFECGWHVGVNFACGVQRWREDGGHLYSYNLSSSTDELYDLREEDARNLASSPAHKNLRQEMIGRLGAVLERDPRWLGYWSSFRIDHYFDLPQQKGDMQLRAAI